MPAIGRDTGGTVFGFEAQMLLENGDPTVNRFVELDLEAEALLAELGRRLDRSARCSSPG
jgi:hypothetical protein